VTWTAVHIRDAASAEHRDALTAALFAHGAAGVQDEGGTLITSFPDTTALAPLLDALAAIDSRARVDTAPLPDIDWTTHWKRGLAASVVDGIRVGPPWLVDGDDPRGVAIDPGMGFGTGEHASTRAVLRVLQRIVRPGDVVADLGTGSGVLAIAAAKLGAARVAAIELDADAIGNAEANVERNGVADRVHVVEGDAAVLLPLVAPVRVVVANILASVLVPLLPVVAAALAPDGRAVLSGILLGERDTVVAAIARAGCRITDEVTEIGGGDPGESAWWCVALGRL
jgi:ribosomal protein L11 methyltransferase